MLLPFMVITIGFLVVGMNSWQTLGEIHLLRNDILVVKKISHLINVLQEERGKSSGYLANYNPSLKLPLEIELLKQQKRVDSLFESFLKSMESNHHFYETQYQKLLTLRLDTKNHELNLNEIFDGYTSLIGDLQKYYMKRSMHIPDADITRELQVYGSIVMMKEALGQIRASFNAIFSSGTYDAGLLYRAIHAQGIYDGARHHFYATALQPTQEIYQQILLEKSYLWVDHTIHAYTTQPFEQTDVDATLWWDRISHVIEQFYAFEKHYFAKIEQYSLKRSEKLEMELFLNCFFFILFFSLFIWIGNRLKGEIINSVSLLEQYRQVVDRSSIVSKTDRRGIITYVNQQFCDISGYSKEELLGKEHNMVRHPSVPKEVFRELWKTLGQKRVWTGILKNRKKDGTSYTVEATISPIIDHNGKVQEFIAIRKDITEVLHLNEELAHAQKDLIYRMSELTEARSLETGYHIRRVAKYAEMFAHYCQLSEQEIGYISVASPMHDIGKIGIEDSILHKEGSLTAKEWEVMKTHTTIGYNLFKDSDKPLLKAAAIIAHQHHEKFDGTGYPQGLAGEKIHIFARITALADTFDALQSKRSYKDAWSDEKIFKLIKEESGKHFDPRLVEIFFAHLNDFLKVRDAYLKEESMQKQKQKTT